MIAHLCIKKYFSFIYSLSCSFFLYFALLILSLDNLLRCYFSTTVWFHFWISLKFLIMKSAVGFSGGAFTIIIYRYLELHSVDSFSRFYSINFCYLDLFIISSMSLTCLLALLSSSGKLILRTIEQPVNEKMLK